MIAFFTLSSIVFFPRLRMYALGCATLLALAYAKPDAFGYDRDRILIDEMNRPITTVVGLAVGLFLLVALQRVMMKRISAPRRWLSGCVVYVILYAGLLWLAGVGNPAVVAAASAIAVSMSHLLWYFAYDLQDRPNPHPHGWLGQIAYYRPFWSVYFYAPIPKGEIFWRQIDQIESPRLPELRLKSTALVVLGTVFLFAERTLRKNLFLDSMTAPLIGFVPAVDLQLRAINAGITLSLGPAWLGVLLDFALNLLAFMGFGHVTIGLVRFCGFLAPLNTDRPWAARTALDFFQRYNFYYKELLFQMFFFPLFARLKFLPLSLRVAAALLGAVGVGNFLIIFTHNSAAHLTFGLIGSLSYFANYAVYCLLLSALLVPPVLSQLKNSQGTKPPPWRIAAGMIFILVAFAVIGIFDERFSGDVTVNFKLLKFLFTGSV